MKTTILVLFATVLISSSLFAQEKAAAVNAPTTASKPLTVSGKVSDDRKTLLTDIDSEWMVSNSDALKGYEGRLVRVKCYVDTERNRIQVLSVKKDGESNYASRLADSAFRR